MATDDAPNLHLPRILCLHGGGVNAEVFHAQCRALRYHLDSTFRLCFVDAPFFCDAGPGVLPVYADYGPFRRWLRWLPDHPEIDTEAGIKEIDYCLQRTMEEDDRKGGTGEWVGLLGFSQGATVSASLLFRQQARGEKLWWDNSAGSNYRFAILLAGRAPLVALDPGLMSCPALRDPSQTSNPDDRVQCENKDHLLRLPTLHVHGLQDPGLKYHRRLLDEFCEKGTTRLIEWDGEHRVPIKPRDVDAVVKQILEIARETGAIER